MMAPKPMLLALLLMLAWLCVPAWAEVSLPNGTVGDSVVDMRVKVLGGYVTIERQFDSGKWLVNPRWKPAELDGQPIGDNFCQAYPQIKIQDRAYSGDGQTWTLENRYSVRTTDYFTGTGCAANRIKTLRWQDRTTSQWMEYQRNDASTLQFQLVKYGDRNNVAVNLVYDDQNRLQEVRDHFGSLVFNYAYVNGLLTEIQDNPALIPGNTAPLRRVKYEYATTSRAGQSYPVIVKVTDVLGNPTLYTVTGGNLTSITDAEGRKTQYQYTADRITKTITPDGEETTYVYDYDKLKKQFYVRVTEPATVAGSRITENWYDSEGILIRRDINYKSDYLQGSQDTATRSQTRTDASGRKTEIVKDEFGNIVKTTNPDGTITSAKYSSSNGQVLEETDEAGVKTQYEYDTKGNLLKKTDAVGLLEQRITEYEYDSLGRLTRETRKGISGAPGASGQDVSVSYAYDDLGNRTQVTDSLGKLSRYAYDLSGRVTQLTDAADHVWKAEYDAAGHITARIDALGKRIEAVYDKAGNRIKSIDALGNITQFAVDGRNRITQTTNALGGTLKINYDAQGRVIAEINEAGQTVARSSYDAQGQLLSTQDAAGNTTTYEYDSSVTPFAPVRIKLAGLTREMRFDARDRVVEQIESHRETGADGIEKTVSTRAKSAYDKQGQLIESTDRLGNKTQMAYDALGRLKSVTDANGGVTQFAYDARDNLLSLTDANGNATRFEYDAINRRVKEIRPLGQVTAYAYDAVGQLTDVTDAKGNRQHYSRDAVGRITKEEHLNAIGSVNRTITYAYNAAGTLTDGTDSNAGHADHLAFEIAITVDALQRKTRETVTLGGHIVNFDILYTATGRKASQTLADGTVIGYRYDRTGGDGGKGTDELQGIELPGNGTISIGSHTWGQASRITYPGGSQRQLDYDNLLRLARIQVKSPGQQTLMDFGYRFDAENNITGRQTEHGDYGYGYDSLNRLTEVTPNIPTGPSLPSERYTYDKLGNRLTDNNQGGASLWQYDANNQLLASHLDTGGGNGTEESLVTHRYDANGSLVERGTATEDPYHNQQYVYDAANRLTEVQDADGNKIASYQYDPQGRRIRKTLYRGLNGNSWLALSVPRTITYFYADEGLAAEYAQDGAGAALQGQAELQAQYGWEPGGTWGTNPLFLKANRVGQDQPEYFFYQNDHLGTPQQLIDKTGDLAWAQRAMAFGKATVVSESVVNNMRFPGQVYDVESGLNYNYYRSYDGGTGRYTQSDPIGLAGGINTYGYVNWNPLSRVDPLGLAPNPAEGACVLGPNLICIGGIAIDALTNGIAIAIATSNISISTRPDGMSSLEERQYDRYCRGPNDPCMALKAAAQQAISAAVVKMNNMFNDQNLYGTMGWKTHGDDLMGRINNINAIISLGIKMGCDMSSEIAAASVLHVPSIPVRLMQ